MLNHLCVTLMIGFTATTYPGADVTADRTATHIHVNNIFGAGPTAGLSFASRSCYMPVYVLDAESKYKHMTSSDKAGVLNNILKGGNQ